MAQVKISFTEEEKQAYEEAAKACRMPLSKYLKKKIEQGDVEKDADKLPPLELPDEIKYQEKSKISVSIPKDVLHSIERNAEKLGMSRADYITMLMVQSGDPVILEYHAEYKAALSKRFFDALRDVQAIRDTATRSGTVYPSELNTAAQELALAAQEMRTVMKRLDRKTNEVVEQINRDLNHRGRKEGDTHGNHKDDPDS